MLHRKTALTLMMALALPGAAQALGLGEIHLESALNEPLAANIDIVGATAEDLAGISASIANREAFQHLGVDRPAFLSTVAFKISRDSSGRAVLAIRSTDACTEPMLDILVDLRWRGGELIRQYTLLLDPPGFPSATPVAEAVVDAPASYAAPLSARPAVSKAIIETSKPAVEAAPASEKVSAAAGEPAAHKTMRVGAKATLRGVAWRVGSRSDGDLKRMMVAIFRANPNAFQGNINRLRRGAVLTIPSATEVSAISVADANHEVQAQMQAWHASTLGAAPTKSVAPAAESAAPAETALDGRIQQLETGLNELRDQLDREHDALVRAQARLTLTEKAPAEKAPAEKAPAAVAAPQAQSGRGLGSNIAAVLTFASAAFGVYAWRRRRAPESRRSPTEPEPENFAPVQVAGQADVSEAAAPGTPARVEPHDDPYETHDALSATPLHAEAGGRQWVADASTRRRASIETEPNEAVNPGEVIDIEALEVSYLLQGGASLDDTCNLRDTDETASLPATVKLCVDDPSAQTMPVETARMVGISESATQELRASGNAMTATAAGVTATKLDYNLLDLDATVQHVLMPSALHENVGFKERRTSLVDALKSAVEREPQRRDLRMKLLETYYAAAATNRQGFLDIVQKIAHERASLNEGEWEKIAWMGRQIASDEDLFAPVASPPDEEDLANCA